jgi:muramoyltetrapeptide carboxypeptidase
LNLPQALKPGATLGVVAPSSPFERDQFQAGVDVLSAMGFTLVAEDVLYEKQAYLAGSDRSRADLVNRMFADPGIDGIIAARGGYGAMRILSLLDVDRISCHPKVFVGFSDITVILNYLVERCGMVAFHGPTVTTLGNGDTTTRSSFLAALTEMEPLRIKAAADQVIRPGSVRGSFCCGNLTLLCHLTGTPYQPDLSGRILMIEDQGEAPYRIDRMLTQMVMAGCFDRLAGLAVGSFTNCGSAAAIGQILADRLGHYDFPILAGFEVGHDAVNTTLPVGLTVELDTDTRVLRFSGPAVC